MNLIPMSKVDAALGPCVARCCSAKNGRFLTLGAILEALAFDPTWSNAELDELRRRVILAFLDGMHGASRENFDDARSQSRP